MLPFLLLVKIPVFYLFGLYRGMWCYTSIADLLNIAKEVAVSSGFIIMSVLYLNRFSGFSRSRREGTEFFSHLFAKIILPPIDQQAEILFSNN